MNSGNVVGLDLSLTATGMARVWTGDHGPEFHVQTIKSTGKRSDTLKQRAARINDIVNQVEQFTLGADLIVIEGPSVMSKGGSNWDRAWLWGSIVDTLFLNELHVAIAPPTVVKKFAAGKGNADKASVAVGVSRLWDQVGCDNDNEWDALAMATMAAQKLRVADVPVRAHHAAALGSVAWPDVLAELTIRKAA